MPNLGDIMPDFEAETSKGKINFHEYIQDSWAILFSHPADYTPVCTTELGMCQTMFAEFEKRKVKMAALSCNNVESHKGWIKDILKYTESKSTDYPFPIISDPERVLAVKLGMVDPDEQGADGMPLTARAVFIIGPDKKLKLSILYPATTGRNFDEIIRVIDSLQLTAVKKVATPVNWNKGDEAMVVPSLTADQAEATFPGYRKVVVPSGKAYMRFTTKYE